MTEKITSLDQIQDPEGFLRSYYGALEDAKNLRQRNKELEAASNDEAKDEEVNKWKARAIKAEAKANLEAQGIKNPDRILKYLNLDGVDIDDDGKLTGLDDKVGEVKTDFPELFDAKKRAGAKSVDIHADTKVEREVGDSEAQVARLFGRTA